MDDRWKLLTAMEPNTYRLGRSEWVSHMSLEDPCAASAVISDPIQ